MVLENKKFESDGFIPMMVALITILVAVIVLVYVRVQKAGD